MELYLDREISQVFHRYAPVLQEAVSIGAILAELVSHHNQNLRWWVATCGSRFPINSHAWVKIVKRAGLKHFRLHDGRHTHASLLLKQNVHPEVVQERLGHATISTTLDLYSHVAPGLQEAAARHFDDAFSPRYNEMADKVSHESEANEKAY